MSQFKEPKDYEESLVVEFDFSSELTAIDSATVAIAIVGDGVDPDVASMLDGALQVSGTLVYQRVQAGVDGVNYKLRCRAISGSNKIVRAKVMAVRAA